MKNRVIRDRYAGLLLLSQRALPSGTAINKVTALLTSRFQRAYEATDLGIKAVYKRFPAPDGDESNKLPVAIAEKRQQALDEFLNQSQPIKKIPDTMRLKRADMPKVLTGDEGWKNADGLPSIIVALGSLYVPEGDEKFEENADGEEPDDASTTAEPKDDFAPPAAEGQD